MTNPTTIVPLTPLAGDSVVDWALAATPDRVVVAVQGQNGTLWTALSRDGVRFTPLAQMPLPPGTEGRRPALCSDGDSVYLAFQTWDLEMSLRAMSMHFYVNRSLESGWTKVASRPVAIPDLYALELTVCGKKLLAVGTDWTGPIQMVTVER
ncbi:MAG: hypothetical protein HY814_09920 [Candidatus Riflebacteria bacterium]|nr:hypothetical protein [Candidatus Riflebacteria bacterium]